MSIHSIFHRLKLIACLFAPILAGGCGGVQEDRTADWSKDGNDIAFQHGKEGVYVADKATGHAKRIFTPTEDTIAVSRPIHSPDGTLVIFATAHPMEPNGATTDTKLRERDIDPDGHVYAGERCRMVCWLGDTSGVTEKADKLFEATLPNSGYIAAGLAVRWDPAGEAVYFLDEVDRPGYLTIRKFNRATREITSALDWFARGIVFDFIPNDKRIACVRFDSDVSTKNGPNVNGLWIGLPNDQAPWIIDVPQEELVSMLFQGNAINWLMHLRPQWTPDGSTFAQVRMTIDANAPSDGTSGAVEPKLVEKIYLGDLSERNYETIHEEIGCRVSDLCIRSDGSAVAYVRTAKDSELVIATVDGGTPSVVATGGVRNFAGWNADNSLIAYSISETNPEPSLASLLTIDRRRRDRVVVRSGDGTGEEKVVADRMHASFVRWSPEPTTLSAWLTFEPAARTRLARSWSRESILRRKDPAATIDVHTGKVLWSAVTCEERIQVGHFEAMHGRFGEALERYASTNGPSGTPTAPATIREWLNQPVPAWDTTAFEAYCFWKMGATEPARRLLDRFRRGCVPPPDVAEAIQPLAHQPRPAIGTTNSLLVCLVQDLYLAEVCISMDDIETGIAILTDQLSTAKAPDERFSRSVVLGQLLLLNGDVDKYVECMSTDALPTMVKIDPSQIATSRSSEDSVLESAFPWMQGIWVLGREGVLSELSQQRRRGLADQLDKLRQNAVNDRTQDAISLLLESVLASLGEDARRVEVARQILSNPRLGAEAARMIQEVHYGEASATED